MNDKMKILPREIAEMERPLPVGSPPEGMPEAKQITASANAYRDNAIMAQGMGIAPINHMRGSMEQIGRLLVEISAPGREIDILNVLQAHLRNGMEQAVMQRRINEANEEKDA